MNDRAAKFDQLAARLEAETDHGEFVQLAIALEGPLNNLDADLWQHIEAAARSSSRIAEALSIADIDSNMPHADAPERLLRELGIVIPTTVTFEIVQDWMEEGGYRLRKPATDAAVSTATLAVLLRSLAASLEKHPNWPSRIAPNRYSD